MPIDSAVLREIAELAELPIPDRTLTEFVVPGYGFPCGRGNCAGMYVRLADSSEAVFITLAHPYDYLKKVREHEYLHFLSGTGAHPDVFRQLGILEFE